MLGRAIIAPRTRAFLGTQRQPLALAAISHSERHYETVAIRIGVG